MAGVLLWSAALAGACQSGSVAETTGSGNRLGIRSEGGSVGRALGGKPTTAPRSAPAASGAEPQQVPEDSPPPAADVNLTVTALGDQ